MSVAFGRLARLSCLVYLLFILADTLVPFDFSLGAATTGGGVLQVTFSRIPWTDIAANIALYAPFGGLAWWWLVSRRPHRSAVWIVLASAVALSVVIEVAQAYSASRISSVIDVGANVIGALTGTWLARLTRGRVHRILSGFRHLIRTRPRQSITTGFAVALFLVCLSPFAVTPDLGHLRQAWQDATWVPFQQMHTHARQARAADLAGDRPAYAVARYHLMKTWTDWVASGVAFALLAVLLRSMLRGEYGFGPITSTVLVIWTGALLAVLLSVLQFPILGRGFHAGDIVVRCVGVVLGDWIGRALWPTPAGTRRLRASPVFQASSASAAVSASPPSSSSPVLRTSSAPSAPESPAVSSAASARPYAQHASVILPAAWLKPAAVFVTAYVVVDGLIPFILTDPASRPTVSARDTILSIPVFVARYDYLLRDLVVTTLTYVVFAVVVTSAWRRLAAMSLTRRLATVCVLGGLLAGGIETAQMFILPRVPVLTDVLLAVLGCMGGILIQHRALAWFRTEQHAGRSRFTNGPSEPAPPPTAPTARARPTSPSVPAHPEDRAQPATHRPSRSVPRQ